MACLRLPLLACCGLAAWAIHIGPGSEEPPDFSVEQRLDELAAAQAAALPWFVPDAGKEVGLAGRKPHAELRTFWGCDGLPFRMAMPAHTGTCTVSQALVWTLRTAGIDCAQNAGQDHDHHGLAHSVIDRLGWSKFNSSISFVMGKDPWSRIVSAAAWMHGFNASTQPDEQIRDFRNFVYQMLPAHTTPSGIHRFNYLHSISEFAYATLPGKSEEEQVLTYVGRVKDMSKSFKHVCGLLGVREEHCVDPSDSRVRQHRVTGEARVRTADLFDDELRGRVAEIWAKDIERFGFVFGEL